MILNNNIDIEKNRKKTTSFRTILLAQQVEYADTAAHAIVYSHNMLHTRSI